MAPPKKKGYSIRFDLSLSGLLGIGVVCFCIFLWMFLLGVWAGQTGLISGVSIPSQASAPVGGKNEAPKRKAPPAPEVAPAAESAPLVAAPAVAAPEAAAPSPIGAEPPGALPEPATPPPAEVVVEPPSKPQPKAKAAPAPFFAIQVGAFRASNNVEDEILIWRARGYEAFSRPPGAKENLTKVYVGRYPNMAAARKQAANLAKKRKISPIIVQIKPE